MAQVADRVASRPEPEPIEPQPTREFGLVLRPYPLVFVALVVVGFLLRIHRLGERALHHDESLHAVYSWYLYVGRGYVHDPMMHGPWQFHWTALIYFLFGDSDFTARLAPVLFGTALISFPYFLRHELGKTGAVIASILLTVSSPFLYFSRFAREDIYAATWTMLIVVGLFGVFRTRQRSWFYLAAFGFAGAFATKESIYLTSVIFLGALFVLSAPVLAPALSRRLVERPPGSRLGELLVAWVSIGDQVTGAIRAYPLSVWLKSIALVVGFCAVLFTTFFTNMGDPWNCLVGQNRKCTPGGLWTGTVGALTYWIDQHDVQRGGQPWFYYLLLLPLYELFTLTLAACGSIFWLRGRRTLFFWFCLFWFTGALAIYSYAGEKMPWLLVHISSPLTLLAGMGFGAWLERLDLHRLRRAPTLWVWGLGLLGLATIVAGAALGAVGSLTQLERQTWVLERAGMLVALLGIIGGIFYIWRRYPESLVGAGLTLSVLTALAVFHVHTSWEVTYAHGDIPVEMLVYVQSSPDVPLTVQEIERIGFQTGQGKNLKILMDNGYNERGEVHEAISWPFEWYLRDYKNRRYFSRTFASDINLAEYPVILVMGPNLGPIRDKLGDYNGQKYRLNWWYPEDYKGLAADSSEGGLFGIKWKTIWNGLTDPVNRARLLQYILYREPLQPLGAREYYLFVRKEVPPLGPAPGSLRSAPSARAISNAPRVGTLVSRPDGSALFGRSADGTSLLVDPKGVAVGPDGRVYVAEAGAHRVTGFNPDGSIALTIGRQGANDGEFNEPWGVAVAANGDVYVADTWNHRIEKFDRTGKLLLKWGSFADTRGQVNDRPGQFWGPRDIAIGPDGSVYISDTGNKRVQVFDDQGRFLRSFGGEGADPGKFREPVGLAFAGSDLLVADTWNNRIQRLDPTGKPLAQYPFSGWEGQATSNKPYLATDRQGRILAAVPNRGTLIVLNADGTPAATLQVTAGAGTGQPVGVAMDPDAGQVYAADSTGGVVVRQPLQR
ncbi:MAG: TIGR03663 family protein [Chloroflexi bacterium]|nr:TIGR03663 family protein [Chloroflexota bacterium]